MASVSSAPTSRSIGRRFTVLTVRYGLPLILLIGGIVCIVLGHADINHVSGNIANVDSGSQVFTAVPTGRNSMFSAIGIGAIIVAVMVWMIGWMMRMNTDDSADRRREEAARDYFSRTGRWPGEPGPYGPGSAVDASAEPDLGDPGTHGT